MGIGNTVKDNLEQWSPTCWSTNEDELLTNAGIVEQLLRNPHYSKIGPATEMLNQFLSCAKRLNTAGQVFPYNLLSTWEGVLMHGAKTVVYTFAIFMLKVEVPKETTYEAKAKHAREVKHIMQKKGIVPPTDMAKALGDLLTPPPPNPAAAAPSAGRRKRGRAG